MVKKREEIIGVLYYEHSANDIRNYLTSHNLLNSSTAILEIGSCAYGILTYLKESNNRFGIDPLESYYSSVPAFTNKRDKSVQYLTAKGETLPFADKMFDLVIVNNVLDHCENPSKVMEEIKRVIKQEGVIYFRQNTYNAYGKLMRSPMELFLVDKGHPFTFKKIDLKHLLFKNKFTIIKSEKTGYFTTWLHEIRSKSIKDKIKAFLFITRDKVTYYIENSK
ncbi:MAG: class I SAM-dependent methyltransferase [Paludibacter sp.]|nr:class I SAM-dependent methyltransferase [Paludibacter sp.]